LSEASLRKALDVQEATGKEITTILLELGLINRSQLQKAQLREAEFQKVQTLRSNPESTQNNFEREQLNSETDQGRVAVEFLKDVVPFDGLNTSAIQEIVRTLTWVRFRPGSIIIKQGEAGSHFYLVRSGLVRVYLHEEDAETLLGFLGEGDCFGEMALVNKEPTAANVEAVEETVCLVQKENDFTEMIRAHPVFYQFFSQLLTRRMKSVYRECLCENPGVGQIEPFLFRKKITEILSPDLTVCRGETTIRDAAARMLDKGRAIVVVDADERAVGVVGLSEIVEGVILGRADPDECVGRVMSKAFGSISAQSYFFDALYQMMRQKSDRLVVLEEDRVCGLLSGSDLLRFRGLEMLSLLRNIDSTESPGQLNHCRAEVEKVLRGLMRDGALASQACRIVSELNDRIVRRVVELAERSCGVPPASYAWLGLGSEGRKEQTLVTDQDNALIYASNSSGGAGSYFEKFASVVVESLAEAGFPPCKGLVTANNEKFRGDVTTWKTRTEAWFSASDLIEKDVMDAQVFLDFRRNAGEKRLVEELRKHLARLAIEYPGFIRLLAEQVVDVPVPLGFFKNFIVEKNGEHKNGLNIKMFGLVPLVTCIKLLAWRENLSDTNTLRRISALVRKGTLKRDAAEFLEQAFETFLTLKIRNNLADWEQGKEPSNYLKPASLSTRQKQLLKEAFLAVSDLQKLTKGILGIGVQTL
jgi:CBS domain-containing protein